MALTYDNYAQRQHGVAWRPRLRLDAFSGIIFPHFPCMSSSPSLYLLYSEYLNAVLAIAIERDYSDSFVLRGFRAAIECVLGLTLTLQRRSNTTSVRFFLVYFPEIRQCVRYVVSIK